MTSVVFSERADICHAIAVQMVTMPAGELISLLTSASKLGIAWDPLRRVLSTSNFSCYHVQNLLLRVRTLFHSE
jgi:hypothetical protein